MLLESIWSSPSGRDLLDRTKALAEETGFDAAATALRGHKRLNDAAPEMLRRAIEIVFTRRQAAFMGAWTEQGLFTREAIEQASHPAVAARHAKRFTGCKHVLEIGSGVGIDTAALAKVAQRVTTYERKDNIAQMTRHNLACQGIDNVEVISGDATELIPTLDLSKYDGIWTDPARRDAGGNRVYNPNDWSPPLSFVLELPVRGPRGIKISPGVNLTPRPDGVSREWIGLGQECLEQTLWSETTTTDGIVYIADLNFEWIPTSEQPLEAQLFPVENLASNWLVEPHAALIRSSHLGTFFQERGIKILDSHIAYGAAESAPAQHPLYDTFKVLESFPYSLGALNERLQALRWNTRSEIKKRGFSETTDEIRRKLKFLPAKDKETNYGVVFVTRVGAEHYAILAERV